MRRGDKTRPNLDVPLSACRFPLSTTRLCVATTVRLSVSCRRVTCWIKAQLGEKRKINEQSCPVRSTWMKIISDFFPILESWRRLSFFHSRRRLDLRYIFTVDQSRTSWSSEERERRRRRRRRVGSIYINRRKENRWHSHRAHAVVLFVHPTLWSAVYRNRIG